MLKEPPRGGGDRYSDERNGLAHAIHKKGVRIVLSIPARTRSISPVRICAWTIAWPIRGRWMMRSVAGRRRTVPRSTSSGRLAWDGSLSQPVVGRGDAGTVVGYLTPKDEKDW